MIRACAHYSDVFVVVTRILRNVRNRALFIQRYTPSAHYALPPGTKPAVFAAMLIAKRSYFPAVSHTSFALRGQDAGASRYYILRRNVPFPRAGHICSSLSHAQERENW